MLFDRPNRWKQVTVCSWEVLKGSSRLITRRRATPFSTAPRTLSRHGRQSSAVANRGSLHARDSTNEGHAIRVAEELVREIGWRWSSAISFLLGTGPLTLILGIFPCTSHTSANTVTPTEANGQTQLGRNYNGEIVYANLRFIQAFGSANIPVRWYRQRLSISHPHLKLSPTL
jgi:hypothetical protein